MWVEDGVVVRVGWMCERKVKGESGNANDMLFGSVYYRVYGKGSLFQRHSPGSATVSLYYAGT